MGPDFEGIRKNLRNKHKYTIIELLSIMPSISEDCGLVSDATCTWGP